MTAGAADPKVPEGTGATSVALTQLIFKLMVTSFCRDIVCGVSKVVHQPIRSPFVCTVEAL